MISPSVMAKYLAKCLIRTLNWVVELVNVTMCGGDQQDREMRPINVAINYNIEWLFCMFVLSIRTMDESCFLGCYHQIHKLQDWLHFSIYGLLLEVFVVH